MADIKCHGNKKTNAVNKTGTGIDKIRRQPDDNIFVESQSKRRRILGNSNDIAISTASIKSEHTDHSIESGHIDATIEADICLDKDRVLEQCFI